MAEEVEEYKVAYKAISASLNTSMAISEDGDLFIWGKSLLLNSNTKHLPTKLGLTK